MSRKAIASGVVLLLLLCSCRPPADSGRRESALLAGVPEISASQLKNWMAASEPLTLIDVREADEWQAGHAPTALHIPRLKVAAKIQAAVPDKGARVVLYCRSGKRSATSVLTLQRLGYTNVFSLAGGLKEYERVGLPVVR
jgi:rhodanese-related sulfurtransferase